MLWNSLTKQLTAKQVQKIGVCFLLCCFVFLVFPKSASKNSRILLFVFRLPKLKMPEFRNMVFENLFAFVHTHTKIIA